MTKDPRIPSSISSRYETHEWRNGITILTALHPVEMRDIITVLNEFELRASEILEKGGSKSSLAKRFDSRFYELGWKERDYTSSVTVDDQTTVSPGHKIDCLKNKVAIEVEWNNKDPFFDRDLNNFSHLYDLGVIDVGVIITRSTELQEIFKQLGKGSSYGNSTTHINKLLPRVQRDGSHGCPLVIFGITKNCFVDDRPEKPLELT